ncbi:MAG: hypothetical protein AB9917_07585 [Negativicutes bacterium]
MMKKNSSTARWICLILVLVMAGVMAPTLVAAAPPGIAPAGTCSFTTPCSVGSQLTDVQSCVLSTELSRLTTPVLSLASVNFDQIISLNRGHGDHHARRRHHCWQRCQDSRHPHRCMERCMER